MADKEVAIKINVDADGGAKSLSELKKEFKETQKTLEGLTAGSKEYIKTLERLGGIKDDIGDLNDEIKAFNPQGKIAAFGNVIGGLASGFQAAQGAAALFGKEGEALQATLLKVQAASAFADGIKGVMGMGDAFKVLGNIIKANPLMLIVSIIIGIGAALFALKDKIGFVGDAFDFVGKIIGIVIQGFKDLTDWMGLTSNASDDLAATQIANAKKTGDAIVSRYDREIARATAAGENTLALEKKKQLAIIETLKLEAIAIIQAAKARREFTDEENKRFTELIALTQKAADEVVIINIKKNKEVQDDNKKANDKQIEEEKKHAEHLAEIRNLLIQSMLEANEREYLASLENQITTEAAIQEQALIDMNATADLYRNEDAAAEIQLTIDTEDEKYTIFKTNADKRRELALSEASYSLEIAQQSNDAMQGLADLYFSIKMANLEKGSAAELKAAKQQFKINKALAITTAIISTIQGVINALTAKSTIPEPYGTILKVVSAVAVGAAGAANVAKISATQFNASGGGGGGSIASLGAAGGGVALEPPSTGSTQLNADGTIKAATANAQPTIKAVVVETDVTKTQKRVSTIEERASL